MALVAAEAAAEKKGTDLAILAVGDVLSIIDVFVLVSGANVRQVRRSSTRWTGHHHLRRSKPISVEGLGDASWVLLDYGDVVVHVFLDETRATTTLIGSGPTCRISMSRRTTNR